MKLGPFDGSMEEVRNLFENHGLRIEDYIEKPPAQLKTKFLIAPAVVLSIVLLLLVLLSNRCSPIVLTLIYILGFGSGTWLTVSTQLKFKNTIATFVVAIGTLLMVLVASGLFSPREAAEFIKDIRGK
jgi:uncharacterized membrane protein YGL010W